MKKLSCCTVVLLMVVLACGVASAQELFTFHDDFESGMSNWTAAPPPQADMQACTPMTWSDARNVDPLGGSYGAYSGHNWDKIYHNLGQNLAGAFTATWYVYDSTLVAAYGEVRGFSGDGWSTTTGNDGMLCLLAAGKYMYSPDQNYYQGRISGIGWFDLDNPGAPQRSTGWHRFDIDRSADGTLNWYVDSILSKTYTDITPAVINTVSIGMGTYGDYSGDAWFDGVQVQGVVPEPSTCLAVFLGISSLCAAMRRRSPL